MPAFESLSFDVFFEISKYLNLDEVAHLRQTCRQLQSLLDGKHLARRTVEVSNTHQPHPDIANGQHRLTMPIPKRLI
jgi:hypothetical protein